MVCALLRFTRTTIAPRSSRDLSGGRCVDTGNGVVVVTDLFGGSPSNLSLLACRPENRRILYGANLPMLIQASQVPVTWEVPEAVRAALAAGRKYIDSQNVSAE